MRRPLFALVMTSLTLAFSQLQADIVLDDVMTQDEQKKTGVSKLTMNQKIALENWLNKNFIYKANIGNTPATQLSLSINIDNGQKIELSDNSIWEVSPDDVPTAAVWITPFPIKITPSNDANYPSLLVNIDTGVSVKARKATTSTSTTPSPAATPAPAPAKAPAATNPSAK